jgi:anti-anti-sigma regulatory factor
VLLGTGLGFAFAARPQVAGPAGVALAFYAWRDRRLLAGAALAAMPWLAGVAAYDYLITGNALHLPRFAYAGELESYGFGTVLRHYHHTPFKALVLAGVVLGVALSFGLLIHRLDHPHVALLGRRPDDSRYEDLAVHGDAVPVPGTLIYRFEAPLIFANAEAFGDGVLAAVSRAQPAPRTVILDLEAVPEMDSTGQAALAELGQALERAGVELLVVRALGGVRADVLQVVDARRFHATVRDAVDSLS